MRIARNTRTPIVPPTPPKIPAEFEDFSFGLLEAGFLAFGFGADGSTRAAPRGRSTLVAAGSSRSPWSISDNPYTSTSAGEGAGAGGIFRAWPHCLHLTVLPAHCSEVVYDRPQWLH